MKQNKIVIFIIFLALIGSLTWTGFTQSQFYNQFWYPEDSDSDSTEEIQMADPAWDLRIQSLTDCDTIDTDANGIFSCGSDDGGGGAFSTSTNDYWATQTNLSVFVNDSGFITTSDWTTTSAKYLLSQSAGTNLTWDGSEFDVTDAWWNADGDISADEISESKINF